PTSIPHMVGLFIYVSCAAILLGAIDPDGFQFPGMPLPIPVPLDQLFSYNGLGLVVLAFCGVGVFVSRTPSEAAKRLGWAKPTAPQVGIGLGLVVFSFLYDALWAVFSHQMGGDLATKLATYNAGTFSVVGGFGPSVILALATAIFAGVGEETLIRGALQPALGILPAAILHGILHGQFSHAPIFIVQVAIWSMCMGIVRRYTNTTTTIIGHAGFNFVTTFLFAFNP
ncbi:MAG TPA: CPBP family intramembrane glutamic endopeptidase, partial [Candidatus Obscuribacterales bacterium]